MFYDKLFSSLDFTLPRAATGRRGFPKEAMVCAFIVMKCEGFSQITDLMDYLDNNRLIAHYCGFNIMEPLPSYWTYDRFLKKLDNVALKEIMAAQVKKLYEMEVVDASFIGLDSTPVAANTKQNNPKSFAKSKFSKENHPKKECAFLADKGYDAKSIYNTVKTVYEGEAFIPLNPRGTKASKTLSAGNPICAAGLAMHKDGKTTDGRGGFGRNSAVPSASPRPMFAPVTTKTGTMGRKTGAAPSIRPFQQTTDFLLTAAVSTLNGLTPCGRSVNVTILVSNPQVRNGCGCVTAQAQRTSIRWLISPL